MGRKLTKEEFVEKARGIYGDKYDYSKVEYKTRLIKIEIICPIHGSFWQTPSTHLNGTHCIPCKKPTYDTGLLKEEDFINRCVKKHGLLYDYSKVKFKNARTKVKIICKNHGEFDQLPFTHLNGGGCNECHIDSVRMKWDTFIERAVEKHGYRYQYIKGKIKNTNSKISIICPKHELFQQKIYVHLRGSICPKCVHQKNTSKPEKEIVKFLKKSGYNIEENNRIILEGKELDIFIPSLNKAIEFNGMYWHYDHSNPKCPPRGYHGLKSNRCREKGIKLLHIREDLWKIKKDKMKEVIIQFLNINKDGNSVGI